MSSYYDVIMLHFQLKAVTNPEGLYTSRFSIKR